MIIHMLPIRTVYVIASLHNQSANYDHYNAE